MSDSMPNCALTVYFAEQNSRFSYFCTNCSNGWQVQPDGSIFPPSPLRVIQFSLKGDPDTASFAGFQVASTRETLPPESTHWHLPAGLVTHLEPTPFPTGNEMTSQMTFRFETGRFFYRLAVVDSSNVLHWDDPKIHDDGSI